jgi:Mn2+/Fe2+ NRAMP family transporter
MEPLDTQINKAQEEKARVSEGKRKLRDRVRGFFADLGPGLITGAADDDPSGISTYSVTGASFG